MNVLLLWMIYQTCGDYHWILKSETIFLLFLEKLVLLQMHINININTALWCNSNRQIREIVIMQAWNNNFNSNATSRNYPNNIKNHFLSH